MQRYLAKIEQVRILERSDELRALAHPLRIRILNFLQHDQPATATTLARALGESTGATSFHLRQLARFGLIREVENQGNGRERWWEASARRYDVAADALDSPEHGAAASLLLARVLERDAAVVSAYLEQRERYQPPWQNAGIFTNHVLYAAPHELEELSERLRATLAEYARPDPSERPPDAVRLYGVLRLVPWQEEAAGGTAAPT